MSLYHALSVDILVVDLLGSFGCDFLCPEIIDDAVERFCADDAIVIPQGESMGFYYSIPSYTACSIPSYTVVPYAHCCVLIANLH